MGRAGIPEAPYINPRFLDGLARLLDALRHLKARRGSMISKVGSLTAYDARVK